MKRHYYRPSTDDINAGAPPRMLIEIPEGMIPPPTIDLHRPLKGTVTYFNEAMYSFG